MKKLLLILLVVFTISCKERNTIEYKEEVKEEINFDKLKYKYQEGQLVYVGTHEFIIYELPYQGQDLYNLQLVDCRGSKCYFSVREDQISNQPLY